MNEAKKEMLMSYIKSIVNGSKLIYYIKQFGKYKYLKYGKINMAVNYVY